VTDLTLLIRLNERVDVRPPSLPAGGGPQSTPNVLLLVGDVGEGTIFTGSFSQQKSYYQTTPTKEVQRDSIKKRIRNPDDPTQHVDVLDVKRIKAKEGTGQQYEIRDVRYPGNDDLITKPADAEFGADTVEDRTSDGGGGSDGGGDS
jgi:hypothetical protein